MGVRRDGSVRPGLRAGQAEPPALSPLHGTFAGARHEPDLVVLFAGWSRLVTRPLGDVSGAPLEGFVHGDTRYVSRYRFGFEHVSARGTMASLTAPNRWCGVFVEPESTEEGDLEGGVVPRGALELTVLRGVEGGWSETLSLVNHSARPTIARVRVELVCPLEDIQVAEELKREARAPVALGLEPAVGAGARGARRLVYRRAFGVRRGAPTRELEPLLGARAPRDGEAVTRELHVEVPADTRIAHDGGTTVLRWERPLGAREESRIELSFDVVHDARVEVRATDSGIDEALPTTRSRGSPHDAEIRTSSATLDLALAQARIDLASLELSVFGAPPSLRSPKGIVAGVPRYIGVFGRDILTTAWQSAMLTPRLLEQAVERMALYLGTREDPFRDEEPGRLPHERRLDPDAELGATNRELYYGDVASTPFWIVTLASAYHWNGSADIIHRHMPVLEATVAFIERRLAEGNGFLYYAPSSPSGNRHHAWKDSGDAIVDGAGRIQLPPIAAAEIQGYCRLALLQAAEMMLVAGRPARAASLFRTGEELAARFRRAFFLPRERFYAVGLDARGVPIDSITSNVGHCLGCGVLAAAHQRSVVDRLMSDEMFSGWGIRTLSASNPAYDPFSYHRGSVWPVENATIAASMRVNGFEEECERIAGAQLAAATLFDRMRLPEAMSGIARSPERPVPGIYPSGNLLQAWSVSAFPFLLQVLLGIRPVGPLRTLLVKPRLPRWLPWVEIRGLHVGGAKVSLEFHRDARGEQRWRAFDAQGTVRVIEHAAFDGLAAVRERLGDHLARARGASGAMGTA